MATEAEERSLGELLERGKGHFDIPFGLIRRLETGAYRVTARFLLPDLAGFVKNMGTKMSESGHSTCARCIRHSARRCPRPVGIE